jgi:hypothetical protein
MRQRKQRVDELTTPFTRFRLIWWDFMSIGFALSMVWPVEATMFLTISFLLGTVASLIYLAYRVTGHGAYNTRRILGETEPVAVDRVRRLPVLAGDHLHLGGHPRAQARYLGRDYGRPGRLRSRRAHRGWLLAGLPLAAPTSAHRLTRHSKGPVTEWLPGLLFAQDRSLWVATHKFGVFIRGHQEIPGPTHILLTCTDTRPRLLSGTARTPSGYDHVGSLMARNL